jgi:hypothetical protein
MQINVPKSQMITKLIKDIIVGLSHLSTQDMELQQKIKELGSFLSQSVDGNTLLNIASQALEIASAYPIKKHKKDPYVINLPMMFQHLIEETKFQMQMDDLADQPVRKMALEVEKFRKLARVI